MSLVGFGNDGVSSGTGGAGPINITNVDRDISVDSNRRVWVFALFIRSLNTTPVTITSFTLGGQTISMTATQAVFTSGTSDGTDNKAYSFYVFVVRYVDFPSGAPTPNGAVMTASFALSTTAAAWSARFAGFHNALTGANSVDPDVTYNSAQMTTVLLKTQTAVGSSNTFTFTPGTETPTATSGWDRYEGHYWNLGLRGFNLAFAFANRNARALISGIDTDYLQSSTAYGTDAAGTANDSRLETFFNANTTQGSGVCPPFSVQGGLSEASSNLVGVAYVFVAWTDRTGSTQNITRYSPRKVRNVTNDYGANQLTAAISALAPTHWWKFNDKVSGTGQVAVGDTILDYGSATAVPLVWAGTVTGNFTSAKGPARRDSYGITTAAANAVARVTSLGTPIASSATGTVLMLCSRITNIAYGTCGFLGLADSITAQKNGLLFGIGGGGFGTSQKAGVAIWGPAGGGTDRRVYSDTGTALPTAISQTPLYDMIVVTQSGGGAQPKIYVNGVLTGNTVSTNGAAIAVDAWFNTYTLNTVWVANTTYGAASQSQAMQSHVAIWDGTVLTPAQISVLYNLING